MVHNGTVEQRLTMKEVGLMSIRPFFCLTSLCISHTHTVPHLVLNFGDSVMNGGSQRRGLFSYQIE